MNKEMQILQGMLYHSNDERVVIWFNNVVRWNVDDWGEYDFQIVLYPDGMIRVNYNEMSGLLNSSMLDFKMRMV